MAFSKHFVFPVAEDRCVNIRNDVKIVLNVEVRHCASTNGINTIVSNAKGMVYVNTKNADIAVKFARHHLKIIHSRWGTQKLALIQICL